MKLSVYRWFRDVSIAKKLYFTVGIMSILIAFELVVLIFSISTLSSIRGYVGGEGLWSKAQKDAMYQLLKYGRSHDEADYRKFMEFMKVPRGAHKALVEFYKQDPDFNVAKQGLEEARIHPGDARNMINLFRRFSGNQYIHKAITIWVDADGLAAGFVDIGSRLHEEINRASPSQERINSILLEIDPINTHLTVLEDEFSYTLGEGSRWLEEVVLRLLFSVALTVECTGLILIMTLTRDLQKGLHEILLSARAVGCRDFSRKAKAFSKDEIGVLANNFNQMSEALEHSISQIEASIKERDALIKEQELVIKDCLTLLGKHS